MPKDTVQRAIAKGTGDGGGEALEEVTYEGYGANGVAVMVECITDNKNRTTPEIRHVFSKYGGNLGTDGCVSWIFKTIGVIEIPRDGVDGDKLLEVALEAGADDVVEESDYFEVRTSPESFDAATDAVKAAGFEPSRAEVTKVPDNVITLDESDAAKVVKLLTILEDHDDVQQVHSNFDCPDEVLEKLG